MQLSMVFSQLTWPQVGDIDDCWVLSGIQAVNVIAPWLYLPGVTAFRAAAGDPDDGKTDGGTPTEIVRGVEGVWPELRGTLRKLEGVSWASARALYDDHRPISLGVISGELPARVRSGGFAGAHQVTIARKADRHFMANPLQPAYSRWFELTIGELAGVRDAALAYGKVRGGIASIYGVAFPTDDEALTTYAPVAAAIAAGIAAGSADAITAAGSKGWNDALDAAAGAVHAIPSR